MAATIIKSSVENVCKLSRLVTGKFWGVSIPTMNKSANSMACLPSPASSNTPNFVIPARGKHFDHHFLNRWMARDYKRRMLVKEHYPDRLRLAAMKRCAVLPREFQETVSKDLEAFPRDSCFVRIKPRCILSSRPRWVIPKHRVSRIHYRLLADYNKLSGTLRATW